MRSWAAATARASGKLTLSAPGSAVATRRAIKLQSTCAHIRLQRTGYQFRHEGRQVDAICPLRRVRHAHGPDHAHPSITYSRSMPTNSGAPTASGTRSRGPTCRSTLGAIPISRTRARPARVSMGPGNRHAIRCQRWFAGLSPPIRALDNATNGDVDVLLQTSICESKGQCGSGHGDLSVWIPKSLPSAGPDGLLRALYGVLAEIRGSRSGRSTTPQRACRSRRC